MSVPPFMRQLRTSAGPRLAPDAPPVTGMCFCVATSTGLVEYTRDRDAALALAREWKRAGFEVRCAGVSVWHCPVTNREYVAKAELDV
jgi:hypothetical protein